MKIQNSTPAESAAHNMEVSLTVGVKQFITKKKKTTS